MRTLHPPLKRKGDSLAPRPREQGGVTIEYCAPGNYERAARALAEAIRREFAVDSTLIASRDGVFEVSVDGKLIFSKRATRRFPETDEIFYHVQNRL